MARHFGVGKETTYGTAVAPTEFSEAIRETLQQNRRFEEITTIRSNSTRVVNQLNSNVGGDVELIGNFQDIGLLLKGFIGSVTTTGAGPYTHTFPATSGTTGRSGLSLTAEVSRDSTALTWRYAGCKVVSYSFSASKDQSPRITFGLAGKSEATGTAAAPSFPTFSPMLVQNLTISFDGVSLDCTELSLEAEWPVDEPYVIGSAVYAKEPLDNAVLKVGGSATVLLTDLTQYAKFNGTTDVDIAIACTSGGLSITHNLNKCRLTAAPINVDGRERLLGRYDFQSFFDATATENLQVVLVNDDVTIP